MRLPRISSPATFAVVIALAVAAAPFAAQFPTPSPLDAVASDPVTMGWMIGAPPPPEKLIRFSDGSWFRFPQTRWSLSHIRQLMPTSVVRRGSGPSTTLTKAERTDIDALTFQPIGRAESMTWAQSLAANYTDGILILHRGRIAYERYFGALAADRQHLAFSVTKSFVATLAATLIAEGALDDGATVVSYLPELRSSAVGDATIRQLMDMTTGLDYTEDYADPTSPVWELSRAGGFLARPTDYRGPESFFDYLKTLKKSNAHGEKFAYKTVNTDALGAVLRRVTGKSLSELLRERIFSRLGAEYDAFFTVDSTGAEFAGGGLNLTLRDLARFGELMCSRAGSTVSKSCPRPSSTTSGRGVIARSSRRRAIRPCLGGATGACGGSRTMNAALSRRAGFTARRSTSIRRQKWSSSDSHHIHSRPMSTWTRRPFRRMRRSLVT